MSRCIYASFTLGYRQLSVGQPLASPFPSPSPTPSPSPSPLAQLTSLTDKRSKRPKRLDGIAQTQLSRSSARYVSHAIACYAICSAQRAQASSRSPRSKNGNVNLLLRHRLNHQCTDQTMSGNPGILKSRNPKGQSIIYIVNRALS